MRASDPFPILYANDVERSAAFYEDAFGFAQKYRWPSEGPAEFVYLELEPSGIGIGSAHRKPAHGLPVGMGPARFELCLYVDDMNEVCSRLDRLGAQQLRGPVDEEWGESRAYYADPDGNPVHLAMRLAN